MAHTHEAPRDLTRNQGLVLDTLTHSHGPLSARVGQNEALLDWFERFL